MLARCDADPARTEFSGAYGRQVVGDDQDYRPESPVCLEAPRRCRALDEGGLPVSRAREPAVAVSRVLRGEWVEPRPPSADKVVLKCDNPASNQPVESTYQGETWILDSPEGV